MSVKKILAVISVFFFFGWTGLQVFSQTATPTPAKEQKWIRVQSDNGEFSIDVPDEYDYFFDEKGFSAAQVEEFPLRDMAVFNSYREGVLLSFESYASKDPKGARGALVENENRISAIEKIKRGDKVFHQMTVKNDKYYLVRQYFISKDHVYILTAGARKEGSELIDKFLKSLTLKDFTPEAGKGQSILPLVPFSALKVSPIILSSDGAKSGSGLEIKVEPNPPVPDVPGVSKIVIIAKPASYYTTEARRNNEQGSIGLKVAFTSRGGISRIDVVTSLGYGLMRQTLLTALRLKYIPKEKDGVSVSAVANIHYGFSIY